MSQRALAERVGQSYVTINRYETGRVSPTVEHALAIAQALDTSVEALFGADHTNEDMMETANDVAVTGLQIEAPAIEALKDDLYRIYDETLALRLMRPDVNGVQKPYVPSRFQQGLDLVSEAGGDYVAYVERLMLDMGPAEGMMFGLVAEGQEGLTVEAQVVDKTKPYHQLFSAPAVAVARDRLRTARALAKRRPIGRRSRLGRLTASRPTG